MIIDTHTHYDDEAFDGDREELIGGLDKAGVGKVVAVCASLESLEVAYTLAKNHPQIYLAAGIHPDDAPKVDEAVLGKIRELADWEKTVAIGEIGLDYYWHKEEGEHRRQMEVFEEQLELAREKNLPFNIHSRDACEDTLFMVKQAMARGNRPGIIHCFSYSWETAKEYLSLGCMLGIGGVVTYKNGKKLKAVVEAAPLTQLVLETDCPYLSPEPFRGKRNHSGNLPYVVEAIAQLKGVTPEEVEAVTWENAHRLMDRL